MANTENYISLIDEIIAKQTLILGADIVMLKARAIEGLSFDHAGKVETIHGDPQAVLQNLIQEFMSLSGQMMKNIFNPILAKYPEIKITIN